MNDWGCFTSDNSFPYTAILPHFGGSKRTISWCLGPGQNAGNLHNHSACAGRSGAWGRSLPTSFLQNLADLHCLLLCSGAVFRRAWNRVPEKKKFHFVKTFGPKSPVKLSFQKIGKKQKCQQSLMPQRFPKFSKRENDFEGHVIWWHRKPERKASSHRLPAQEKLSCAFT